MRSFWNATCLITLTFSLQGQTLNFRHFGIDEGLPNANVWCVNQDAQGYIWFGTNEGLCRFNGLTFEKDFGSALKSQRITDLISISDSVLLANGDFPHKLFRIISNADPVIESLDKPEVGSGHLFPGNSDGTFYFWKHQKLFHYTGRTSQSVLRKTPNASFFKVSGSLLFSGFRHTGVFTVENGKTLPFLPEVFAHIRIHNVIENRQENTIWVHSEHGFHEIRDGTHIRLIPLQLEPGYVPNDYAFDYVGRLWFCDMRNGLHILDLKKGILIKNNLTKLCEDVQVTCIFRDREGTMWISTSGFGVYQIPIGFAKSLGLKEGLSGVSVTNIAPSKNPEHLVIGTNSGVCYVNSNSCTVTGIKNFPVKDVRNVDMNGYIMCLGEWEDRLIYSQSYGSIGKSFFVGADQYRTILAASHCKNYSEALVVGNWGVIRIFPEHSRPLLQGFSSDVLLLEYPGEARVNAMHHFRDTIWVATSSGLMALDMKDTTIHPVQPLAQNSPILNCTDMTQDEHGQLWLATRQGLLCRSNKGWQHYTEANGLSSNTCTSLAWEKQSLWIGTYRGVNRLRDGKFESASVQSGLLSDEVSLVHYDSAFGRLWVGSALGLSYFDTEDWTSEKLITDLWLDHLEVIDDRSYAIGSPVTLDHDQNNIRFTSKLLDLWGAQNTSIVYRLLGASSEWTESRSQQVEFFGLAPGNYTFEIKATSPIGDSQTARATFTIHPPFWFSWWFVVSMLVFIAALAFVVARIRVQQVRHEERAQRITFQRMFQLEQQALAAAMNPHFIFNSLNAIQELFTRHGDEKAIDYVGELAQLMRQNLDSVTHKEIPLLDEIEQLERYLKLEKIRFGKRLKYSVNASAELRKRNPNLPAMLIQPFIENALKHGIANSKRPGQLSIGMTEKGDLLEIAIIDNGIGFLTARRENTSKDHVSRGISIVRKRLALHSEGNSLEMKELTDAQGQPKGTLVLLTLYIGSAS